MTEILSVVRDTWSLLFSSLLGAQRVPTEVVVTLLAVLELVRLGNIRVQQTELFGDIVIERRPGDPAASEVNLAHTE
jgi:segregation and condensation protein A